MEKRAAGNYLVPRHGICLSDHCASGDLLSPSFSTVFLPHRFLARVDAIVQFSLSKDESKVYLS
jgi:hypothetical protein